MTARLLPTWLFHFATRKDGESAPAPVPEDLSGLSPEDLATLATSLDERFQAAQAAGESEGWTAESIEAFEALASDIGRVQAEQASREGANAELANRAAAAVAAITPTEPNPEGEGEGEGEGDGEQEGGEPEARAAAAQTVAMSSDQFAALLDTVRPAAVEGALVEAGAEPIVAAATAARPRLNVPLSEVRRRAPSVEVESRPEFVITAAADVRGFSAGGVIEGGPSAIARAMHARALSLPTDRSGMQPVAQIHREFEHSLSEESTPEQVEAVINATTDPDVLVAAGGWCAPSEILYDLFNISCEDGMIDLPTTGVTRGGIRFPVSPSIADVFGGEVPWTWTEQDDIDAVTGTGTKPCVRVPCPTFEEERLICDGLCITAGNLTERAYPENLANFVELVMAAHFHFMNARFISEVVAASTNAGTITNSGDGTVAAVLSAVELAAIDYRTRFRMCLDDVLEVVLPFWIKGEIRADIARQRGVAMFAVTDAEIMAWFDRRLVRVQFVNDWQVNTTGFPGAGATFPGGVTALLVWPATVQFLIYAAGTYLKGSGPVIDLGVVRDSTLNETNDFTAAWSEECNLIARVGHLGRLYTVNICPDGTVGPEGTQVCPTG